MNSSKNAEESIHLRRNSLLKESAATARTFLLVALQTVGIVGTEYFQHRRTLRKFGTLRGILNDWAIYVPGSCKCKSTPSLSTKGSSNGQIDDCGYQSGFRKWKTVSGDVAVWCHGTLCEPDSIDSTVSLLRKAAQNAHASRWGSYGHGIPALSVCIMTL